MASPAIDLPVGPIYLKFTGQEQIAINGATTYAGTKEINWGVFVISTLEAGDVNTPNDQIDPSGDGPFFVNKQKGGQITGMFYGIEAGSNPTEKNQFPGTKGYMDLYWRDLNKMTATSLTSTAAGIRCGYDCAVGYTQGDFLARLYFDTGMDPSSKTNTIVGSQSPSSNGFSGQADSYASVDMTKKGLWSFDLNSNWFTTKEGQRDLRFKNSYNYNPKWSGAPGSNILGARVDDPGQAFAVPEPGALSLMGLAMIGMGAVLRRRRG
jgi:hypothetical protein